MKRGYTLMIILFCGLMVGSMAALAPLTIKEGRLLSGGKPFAFRGINWFGFNNKQTFVDGLWVGGSSLASDFATIVYKLRLLGFNSVRLPFVFGDLELPPKSQMWPCNMIGNYSKVAEHVRWFESGNGRLPKPVGWPRWSATCNAYLPTKGNTLDRLHWAARFFVKSGMYVVIDYHPMGMEGIARDIKECTRRWQDLWKSFMALKELRGRVIIDILNEPDSMGMGWDITGKLYLSVMDAIGRMDNNVLFMIEGTGQTGYGLSWGNGFVIDRQIIKTYGIDDPSWFFDALNAKKRAVLKRRIIISPHLYGPTVTGQPEISAQQMETQMNASFGRFFMGVDGFPVVLGEFGSRFTDSRDVRYYDRMAKWFVQMTHGQKIKINWMYWCYGFNSADTGGIVRENGQLEWVKIDWLRKHLFLDARSN